MRKIILLGWKDLTLAFRDRAGIILMLLAPFLLTLGLGLITVSFSGGNSGGINSVPLTIVNQDDGQLAAELVKVFQSEGISELMSAELTSDLSAARQLVLDDELAAVVLIPAGFSASIIPDPATGQVDPAKAIELYVNPARSTGAGVVQSIVDQFINQVEFRRIGAQVAVAGLIQTARISPEQVGDMVERILVLQEQSTAAGQSISIKGREEGSAAPDFNILAYMAPGMALMFLMFTVSNGGRTLLVEKTQGTLPRLLVAPLTAGQVLLGKMFGIFLTGSAQMLILIVSSALLFQLDWGNPLAVLALVLAAVVGAVGWGMLLTALVKTQGQASSIGSAVMLIFGILGGSFFEISQLPAWYRLVSRITPNAWGIDGFSILAAGGGMLDILPDIFGLLVMGAILFAFSLWLFARRGIIQH